MATEAIVLPLNPVGDSTNFLAAAQTQINQALADYEAQGFTVLNVFQVFIGAARGIVVVVKR